MKKRIIYVFGSTNYSGAEIVMERLILNSYNIDALIICPPGEFSERLIKNRLSVHIEKQLSSLNIKSNNYNKFFLILLVIKKFIIINFRLTCMCIKYKFSVVHANNLTCAVYILPSVFLGRFFFKNKVKFIWSNHDLKYPDGETYDKLSFKCVKFFDQTLAVSKAVKEKYSLKLQEKIVVLYNGLNTDIFALSALDRKLFREEYKLSSNTIAIAIIGVICERKGHELLIDVFKEISQNGFNIKLFIIGKFNQNEKIYEINIKNKISNSKDIVHIPFIKDIAPIYSGLDIVINNSLPNLSEPLGTTIYEGMSCERLVLASNTGGSPEIISNEIDGFLFKAGDRDDLKSKLLYLIHNNENLSNVKKNARLKVRKLFSINTMVENYDSILSSFYQKNL